MELHEFAQCILDSTSLEDKLAPPLGELTDLCPGPALGTPSAPGRPEVLRMSRERERAVFPGLQHLRDDAHRGLLLHFFANHELLATELMALVLLKFPDAPPEFRAGVLRTLREEQRHTRWYVERMRECGVRFGDFPVSGYFWDMVAPMETPLDYVTRLSLTFEQANLDYARHYAGIFQSAGDEKSAKILGRIYRDEIGHVGYGLHWFRQWKQGDQSDWQAFEARLVFPLSPSRAKGNGVPYNSEGRLQAGLEPGFVEKLELFERSRGRTPNVYWFTPDEEAAMAGGLDGKGYIPRQSVAALAQDLGILPAFLSRRDDVVLVRQVPTETHLRRLRGWGFELPEFEQLSEQGSLAKDSLLRERKLNELRPWAWGPQSAKLFASLLPNLPGDAVSPEALWNPVRRETFAKTWSLRLLRRLADSEEKETIGQSDKETWIDPAILGQVCSTADEVKEVLREIVAAGFANAVLKAPFGAAGQKNHRVAVGELALDKAGGTPALPASPWMRRVLEQQGAMVVEPWLERVLDFSVQWNFTPQGLRQCGFIVVENDTRGQFVAALCGNKLANGLSPELARFFMTQVVPVYGPGSPLTALLESALCEAGHHGPLGIDAFVYRRADGTLRLKPIVEINPRFTMGRVAWELQRRVSPGQNIRFALVPLREFTAFPAPVLDANGLIRSGSVPLNDPDCAKQVVAVLTVGK